MRFLHTADLHLGKQMNDLSLLEDQKAVLEQVIRIAGDEKVDAVLIAGDVYQRTSPQAEAMALFDSFVSRLAADGRKVFVISGNHDSALRISYFSSLVRDSGVYVTEAFTGEVQHVTLRDRDGDVTVWMLPFLRPAQVRRALPEEKITSYQDAVAAVLRHADIDHAKRNVLMCHQFIVGCETCDSEELSIGTLDHIDGTVFDGFDYVALGHIHGPQRVLRDTMRYAGSPLKYSFSEASHKKSVTIVDLYEKGDTKVRTVPLYPLHDVRLMHRADIDAFGQRDAAFFVEQQIFPQDCAYLAFGEFIFSSSETIDHRLFYGSNFLHLIAHHTAVIFKTVFFGIEIEELMKIRI